MSYYRSFASLVSLLGVITLGLIAAVVYLNARMVPPAAMQDVAEEPATEFDPPWADVSDIADDGFDRKSLEIFREADQLPSRADGAAMVDPVIEAASDKAPATGEQPPATGDIDHAGLDQPVDIVGGLSAGEVEQPVRPEVAPVP